METPSGITLEAIRSSPIIIGIRKICYHPISKGVRKKIMQPSYQLRVPLTMLPLTSTLIEMSLYNI